MAVEQPVAVVSSRRKKNSPTVFIANIFVYMGRVPFMVRCLRRRVHPPATHPGRVTSPARTCVNRGFAEKAQSRGVRRSGVCAAEAGGVVGAAAAVVSGHHRILTEQSSELDRVGRETVGKPGGYEFLRHRTLLDPFDEPLEQIVVSVS